MKERNVKHSKKMVSFRTSAAVWLALKRLAQREGVTVEKVAECAVLAFVSTADRLAKESSS